MEITWFLSSLDMLDVAFPEVLEVGSLQINQQTVQVCISSHDWNKEQLSYKTNMHHGFVSNKGLDITDDLTFSY